MNTSVGMRKGGTRSISASAFLTVLVPPENGYPSCVQPDSQNLAVGDYVHLQCLSHGGSPPAKLVWIKDGIELTEGVKYNNEFEWFLDLTDLSAEFTCRAESPAITQARTCTTTIQVRQPEVTIQPYIKKVEVGDTVTFLCVRQDKPTENRFRWFYNGQEIDLTSTRLSITASRFNISDYNRALTISGITEEDSGASVRCGVRVLPELPDYSAQGMIMVKIITGEVLGTLPPPRLQTNVIPESGTNSEIHGNENETSTAVVYASGDRKQTRDSTAMIVILGAGGGLLVVVVVVVVNYLVVRRKRKRNSTPKPNDKVQPVATAGASIPTKNSDKSLSSSDSGSSTRTTTTTATKKGTSPKKKSASKEPSPYAELDSNGMRLCEYQGLNAPPMTIYAEPVIAAAAPTKLVPRPQHQDGYHDYALPDILPELPGDDYVEPDPLPKNGKGKEQPAKQKEPQKESGESKDSDKTQQNPTESVYIEIIA